MITINVQQLGVYGRAVRAGCRRDREAYLSHLVDRLSQGPANDILLLIIKSWATDGESRTNQTRSQSSRGQTGPFVRMLQTCTRGGGNILVTWREDRLFCWTTSPAPFFLSTRMPSVSGHSPTMWGWCPPLALCSASWRPPSVQRPRDSTKSRPNYASISRPSRRISCYRFC